ncbi:hypothetical protein J3A83DRAFT_4089165, partial [Scleroderma citrinum]
DDSDEEFVYPAVSANAPSSEEPPSPDLHQSHPSPAQLEALCAAASSGDLTLLKKLFSTAVQSGDLEPFALANDASSRTGFTPLHSAANRGYFEVVQWLIEECGAMPDLEDREGETALHKAALHGHLAIVQYLLPNRADVHASDADGWTALHNACSKGYLDVVIWLCESGGAANEINGVKGVDLRSKGGWTPLMNAASKGHLPVILYLLKKQGANPLVRNTSGETAYDIAAAVFEVRVCEVIQKAEAERWRYTTVPYNPLAVHIAVPLILYENQRLDTRLKTFAASGGKPNFSASGLGKYGRRPPFELKLPSPDEETGVLFVASQQSDVQLPVRAAPYTLPNSPGGDSSIPEGTERSHFWWSEWILDTALPEVDAESGWQYAQTFDAPEEAWTAEAPPYLGFLSGTGFMTLGLTSPVRTHSRGSSSSIAGTSTRVAYAPTWVRRRRWVRVMHRRLDIPPLPFMEPDGALYHLAVDGSLVPCVSDKESNPGDPDGQELGAMPPNPLLLAQDYVARARYLVGNQSRDSEKDNEPLSVIEVHRAIAKLEHATTELRQGILGDEDNDRRTQAEVLLNAYSRELERRRLTAGAQGLLVSESTDGHSDGDSDEDNEFHYPGYSSSEQPHTSFGSADHRLSVPRAPIDLTPHLSKAAEFRVPTREAPQKMITSTKPTPHPLFARWQRDNEVQACNDCQRRFTLILRKHCRRCGHIFCDRCSSHRAVLDPSDTVSDLAFLGPIAATSSQRVCRICFDALNGSVPARFQPSSSGAAERNVTEPGRLSAPGLVTRQNSSSQLSDLAECPGCGVSLADWGLPPDQEAHIRMCLEGRARSPVSQSDRYLVYKLPAGSALLGDECVICLEEFTKGSEVARLSCLCSFHNACLTPWLDHGRSCPIHAR